MSFISAIHQPMCV